MTHPRRVQTIAIIGLLCCLVVAGLLVPPINTQRKELQLTLTGRLDKTAPPHIVLATTALSAFRGLIVDILWYRANEMKEDGKFFEANQLAQWITALQPQFGQVWAFHAWNMAYNISVMTHTAEERWGWVRKGIDLLRDKAVIYAPNSPRVYRELGWIFFHKVGQYSDDMHWYYKTRMAFDMQQLVGAPTPGATTEQVVEEFKKIVDVPRSESALFDQHPELVPLVADLRELDMSLNEELLRQIGLYEMFSTSLDAKVLGTRLKDLIPTYNDGLLSILQDPAREEGIDVLLAYLRSKILREKLNMDVDFMYDLMDYSPETGDEIGFGPLDWRHPNAHALYWSAMGVKVAEEKRNKTDVDALNMDRQVIHSLQNLTDYGRLSFDPVTMNLLDQLPDPRFIPAYERQFDWARARVESGEFNVGTAESFDSGHENFLLKAIYLAYVYGDEDYARELRDKARRLYADKPHNIRTDKYTKPLSESVMDYMMQNMELMGNTGIFVDAMIQRAFIEGLANGDSVLFNKFISFAEMAHRALQERGTTTAGAIQDRMRLPPFDEMLKKRFAELMQATNFPVLLRARVWAVTPLELRQASYDQIRNVVATQAQQANIQFATAFPEPEGMEEVRAARGELSVEKSTTSTSDADAKVRVERQ